MSTQETAGRIGLLATYHLISKDDSRFAYGATERQMDAHLQRLASLSHTLQHGHARARVCFDDGHASQFRYGLPLLEKHGIGGIFFCIAGWTDKRPESMASAQLRELVSLGHEVQSHGLSHCMLTRCAEPELKRELQTSRSELEQKIGRPVDALSLPFGRWNLRVLDACAEAGYKRVYTSDALPAARRPVAVELLGRFMVRRSTTAREFEQALLASGNRLRAMQAVQSCKRIARLVVGEGLYHSLWGLMASRRSLDQARSEYESEIVDR